MSKILAFILAFSAIIAGCDNSERPPPVFENAPGQVTYQEKLKLSRLNIRVGGDANYPPFVYKDDNGKLIGLSVDFFEETARRLNVKYEITFVGQRADMLKKLQEKEIDVTLASRTASSRPYLIATQPYEYSKGTLLVLRDFDPANIKTVGAGRGYASVTWLKTNKPQYTVVEYDDDAVCIKNLIEKQVNSCIMGREIAFFFLEKLKLKVEDFNLTPVEYNYFLSFGVHTDNIELVDILIKGLEAIPNSRRNEILKKWLKEPYI